MSINPVKESDLPRVIPNFLLFFEGFLEIHLVRLPQIEAKAFQHYGEDGVPLFVVENMVPDLLSYLDERQIADLMYRLDCDVLKANGGRELTTVPPTLGHELAQIDDDAIASLAADFPNLPALSDGLQWESEEEKTFLVPGRSLDNGRDALLSPSKRFMLCVELSR